MRRGSAAKEGPPGAVLAKDYAIAPLTLAFADKGVQQEYEVSVMSSPNLWTWRVRAHALHAAYNGAYAVLVRTRRLALAAYLVGGYEGIFPMAICVFSTLMAAYSMVCRRAELERRAQSVSGEAPSQGGLWNPAGLSPRARLAYHILLSWPPVVIRAVSVIFTTRGVLHTSAATCTAVLQTELSSYGIWALMTYGPILTLTGFPWPVVAPTILLSVVISFVVSYLQGDLCGVSEGTLKVKAMFSAAGNLMSVLINYVIANWPLFQWRVLRTNAEMLALSQELVERERQVAHERTMALGTLAHDIGTPLTALVLAVDAWKAAGRAGSAAKVGVGGLGANGVSAGGVGARGVGGSADGGGGVAGHVGGDPSLGVHATAAVGAGTDASTHDAEAASETAISEAILAVDVSLHAISQLRKTILHHVALQDNPVSAQLRLGRVNVSKVVEASVAPLLKQLVRTRSTGAVQAIWHVGVEAGRPLEVTADPDWLIDMLLNLVGNAVKFTSKGHVALRATARRRSDAGLGSAPITGEPSKRQEDEVLFEVEDTGVGISAEDAAKLFQPYVQVAGTRGGTGLGLASVASKVKILGGVAGIGRNEHGGATVWFTLPRRPCGAAPVTAVAAGSPCAGRWGGEARTEPVVGTSWVGDGPAGALGSGAGDADGVAHAGACHAVRSSRRHSGFSETGARDSLRVLVVDDSPMITRLVSASLRQLGVAEASCASSGPEALAMLFERATDPSQFNLAIVDSEMNGMRGVELAVAVRQAQQRAELPAIRMILLTGNSIQRMLLAEPIAGQVFDGQLEKPVSTAQLATILADVRRGNESPGRVMASADTPIPPGSVLVSPQGSFDDIRMCWSADDLALDMPAHSASPLGHRCPSQMASIGSPAPVATQEGIRRRSSTQPNTYPTHPRSDAPR